MSCSHGGLQVALPQGYLSSRGPSVTSPGRASPSRLGMLLQVFLLDCTAPAACSMQTIERRFCSGSPLYSCLKGARRNGLNYISTRTDIGTLMPHTRGNQCILYSRKLGHLPLATLWETRKCVSGLEFLKNSHFSRNYVSGDAMIGKMPHVDIPSSSNSTLTSPTCPNEVWHMDTFGPTKTRSLHGIITI